MRQYIRHPNDIPIECDVTDEGTDEHLKDVSEGGLCFAAEEPIESGAHVHIEIPVEEPPFTVDGTVVWCERREERYDVGVQFSTKTREFSVRMVEQVCQIEHYRKEILATEGRELSCEEAAAEWIARNAADFPR